MFTALWSGEVNSSCLLFHGLLLGFLSFQENVGRRAVIAYRAVFAVGVSGLAGLAAVEDEQVGEKGPVFLGDDGHQVLFDFDRVLLLGQAQSPGKAGDMGVDDDAYVDVKGVAEDDVGRLAA